MNTLKDNLLIVLISINKICFRKNIFVAMTSFVGFFIRVEIYYFSLLIQMTYLLFFTFNFLIYIAHHKNMT